MLFFLILIVGIMSKKELLELGLIIKSKRQSRNMTQVELANKSGVDRNYVGMLERGERNPSYLTLLKIAKGLNIKIHLLIKP